MILLLSLPDLVTPKTPKQAEDTILSVATSVGLPITAWRSGGVVRSIVKVFAIIYSAFTQIVAIVAGGGFLDFAVSVWLTLLAKCVYNVARIEATFATAAQGITLQNDKGGRYEIEPGDLTFSGVVGGVKRLYRNTSGGVLLPGPGTSLKLDIKAVEIGASSNAAPGVIDTLEDGLLGVSCINEVPVLGQDQEIDELLRQRCRDSLGALSPNGPKQAYRYFAKSAVRADGSSIGVTRVKILPPPGDGSLTVLVATDAGVVPGTVGDLNTDLGIIDDGIQNNVVPIGVGPVTVASAVATAITISADIYVDIDANLDDLAIAALVNAALASYFKTIPIGGMVLGTGKVFKKALEGVIRAASPYFIKVDVTVPASDDTIAADHVPVFSGPATLTNHQVEVQS